MDVKEIKTTRPINFELPTTNEIEKLIPGLIAAAYAERPAEERITTVRFIGVKKGKKDRKQDSAED